MKHWGRWLLFEQLLFFPKHVTLSEKMRLAWLVSIPLSLLTSSEVLSCTGGTVMSLGTLEKCHLLPERIPSFFEQNVLKAVGRTQIEGSYKVKTTWKLYPWSLASRSEEHLKHPDRWLLFACCKACDGVGEDAFSVASQHSSVLLFRSTNGELLSCAQGADMSLDMSEKSELVPVRISSLLEQNLSWKLLAGHR